MSAYVAIGMAMGGALVVQSIRSLLKKRKTTLKGPREKVELELVSREDLSHNSRLFTFALPGPDWRLGLPVGQHVSLYCTVEGKLVIRAYTPVTNDATRGVVKLAIKVYPDGKMTQYLEKMKVGEKMLFAGPKGEFEYKGNGKFTIKGKSSQVDHFGMIAGGSGITPVLQIIEAIYNNEKDKTKVSLIYANQTEDDILLRETLEEMAVNRKGQFNFYFTLDRPADDWTQGKGFITEAMIKENLPPSTDDTIVLMCGPPPMLKYACEPNLTALGYSAQQKFVF